MTDREVKDTLFEQFARISRALDSPKRIELLEILAQGERGVNALARVTGMGVTNTSAHLNALRRARLVEARKEGTGVLYRLADDQVARFLGELRALAYSRLAELQQAVREYFDGDGDPEPVTSAELLERLEHGTAVVLDVRPTEEYASGHIAGALSVPLESLEAEIAKLQADTEVIAYCRGPYCLLAPKAVLFLRRRGFRARRLEDGFPEWRLAGLPSEKAG